MTPEILADLDADSAALAAAGSAAEEALALHREALAILVEGWRSQSGCDAVDLLRRQCADAADVVTGLHGAAVETGSLRDALAMPDGNGVHAESDRQALARTAARLADRPATGFDASPSPPTAAAAPPPPQPAPAPAPTPIPLPNLGGALPNLGGAALGGSLVALVAQLADALGRDGVDPASADGPSDKAAPKPDKPAVPRDATAVTPKPVARPLPLPVTAPATSAPAQTNTAVPQPDSAQPPLLAAERPPAAPPVEPIPQPPPPPAPQPQADQASPQPPEADPRTPCEIAADELPQVGE